MVFHDQGVSRKTRLAFSAFLFIASSSAGTVFAQDGTDLFPTQNGSQPQAIVVPETRLTASRIPDEELTSLLEGIYSRVPDFTPIDVSTDQGVVTLSGIVRNLEVKQRAQEIAEQFEGVFFVNNNLELETRIQNRIAFLSRRIRSLLDRFLAFLPTLTLAFLSVVVFWILAVLITKARFLYKPFRPLRAYLMQSFLKILLILTGFVFAVFILDITAVVGAAAGIIGILGIAFGFAFKDIVLNYLAGFLLSVRSPFRVNDLVKLNEFEGRVVRLSARELVLLTLDGNHIMIPNSEVYRAAITNYTRNPRRRLEFTVVLGQDEDFLQAEAVGVEALRTLPGIIPDPGPFMWIDRIEEHIVTVRFLGWLDQRSVDWFKARSEAIRLVKTALNTAGMKAPEARLDVYLFNDGRKKAARPEPPGEPSYGTGALHAGSSKDYSPDREIARQMKEESENDSERNLLKED